MTSTIKGFDYLNLESIPASAYSRHIPPNERPLIGQTEKCNVHFPEAFPIPIPGKVYDYKNTKIHLFEKNGKIFAYSASQELPDYVLKSSLETSAVLPVQVTYLLFGAGHQGLQVRLPPNQHSIPYRPAQVIQSYGSTPINTGLEMINFAVNEFEINDGRLINIATYDYTPTEFEVRESANSYSL